MKRDVRRAVQIGNDLDVVVQPVIGQLLELRWGERIGLDQRRRMLVLEMAFEFDGESVDLVESRLAHRLFQNGQGAPGDARRPSR